MAEGKKGFFGRLVEGLAKTRNNIVSGIDSIFSGFSAIDDDFYEEIEETLIMGDLGIETTMSIVENLRRQVKERGIKEPEECKELLIESIKAQMDLGENAYEFENRTSVVLVIGVNGVGKTTSVGKLAGQLKDSGRKVVLAAADTFRAAAIEQLTEWANRAGVDIIAQQEGSDPAAVIYDAVNEKSGNGGNEMYYDTQSAPRPDNGGKTKVWKIIALVLLLLCALPVLIPAALCVGGGVLVMALCVAGAVLTAVLCVAGGVICAGLCVLGGLLCLALLQLAALIGIGFGVVLLFQTPASGLAILGVSLLITGAGALCWIALWQLVVLLVKGFRTLVNWIRRRLFGRREAERKERGEQTVQDAQAVNHGFGSENFGKNMPETETTAADEEIRTDITEVGKGADEDE